MWKYARYVRASGRKIKAFGVSDRMGHCFSHFLVVSCRFIGASISPCTLKSKGSQRVVTLTLSEVHDPTSLASQVIRLHKPPHHVKVTDLEENSFKLELANVCCADVS
jgi:hypothetical protein